VSSTFGISSGGEVLGWAVERRRDGWSVWCWRQSAGAGGDRLDHHAAFVTNRSISWRPSNAGSRPATTS
jgi:hypothetical protein